VRPGRGSRPRTRERPAYTDAVEALVVAVNRGRYLCHVPAGGLLAVRGGNMRRTPVVVGDRVLIVGDTSGQVDTLARIVGIVPRRSVLRRSPDDQDPLERPVVANADQLVIVTALANPEPRPRLIDRCLVVAFDGGLDPLLCLTKSDLAGPEALTELYSPLGLRVVVSGREDGGAGAEALRRQVAGRMSCFFGHSGVGKSTLVNALLPGADRLTAEVNETTGRGRHTTSAAIALPLGGDGWVIDTPGVRTLGLGHVSVARVLAAFPDLAAATAACPRGCPHTEGAPECGLDGAQGGSGSGGSGSGSGGSGSGSGGSGSGSGGSGSGSGGSGPGLTDQPGPTADPPWPARQRVDSFRRLLVSLSGDEPA